MFWSQKQRDGGKRTKPAFEFSRLHYFGAIFCNLVLDDNGNGSSNGGKKLSQDFLWVLYIHTLIWSLQHLGDVGTLIIPVFIDWGSGTKRESLAVGVVLWWRINR